METIDYTDSSAFIRRLEEAERGHTLDAKGALDELGKAAKHCAERAEYHSNKKNAYMLAKAAYIAEAHRRTVMTKVQILRYARAIQRGEDVDPPVSFKAWCAEAGINRSNGIQFAKIGNAPQPVAALNEFYEKQRPFCASYRDRVRQERAIWRDPVLAVKAAYRKLSPVQRQAFLSWALGGMDEAKAAAD